MASFNVTGDAEMPDAMTIIFQKALAAGLSGAVSNSFSVSLCFCF